jgi:acyl-CoA reductase-like NAD-dependent aldehyde dehydrogenase
MPDDFPQQFADLNEWYEATHLPLGSHAGRFDSIDPSTETTVGSLPNASAAAVATATETASNAQPGWAGRDASQRGEVLRACADGFEAVGEEIARLLSAETGKAIRTESRGEVALLVDIFRYFAGLTKEVKGHTTNLAPDVLGFVTRHPYGVVGGIVPWNVPLMLMAYKVAAPLAAGNTCVVKLPEQASYTLLRVLQILDSHLPTGVCQFLTGGPETGRTLVADANIDKVSFTGSVQTGREVYVDSAKLIRPVTLELGGKSPMIILADCDIDTAVNGVAQSMRFTRGGQSCTAASRVYIHRSMLASFRDGLRDRLNQLVIGHPLDEATDCGPLVSTEQRARVVRFLENARADGLTVESFGTFTGDEQLEQGCYVQPHVVFDPPSDHPIAIDEIFGPVVCIFPYDDPDDALDRANDSDFGLSASIWGQNITTCMQLANRLRAGIVQINQNAIMVPGIAYGGLGNSGIGKEGSLEAMLESYTFAKTNILNFSD